MRVHYTVDPQRHVIRNGKIYAIPKSLSLTERIANKTRVPNSHGSINLAVIKVL